MASNDKKVDVNAASMIDLKAELLRKTEQFKQERLEKGSIVRPTPKGKKASIWSKKNAGVLERAHQDLEAKREEEDVMGRSKSALEAKAALYEKMVQGQVLENDDPDERFLVDFERKAVGVILGKREERLKQEEEAKRRRREEEEEIPPPTHPGEEWVDYVDADGKSRRCLRQDLEQLEKRTKKEPSLTLLSDDMRREMLRKKWEEEEEEALKNPVGPVHYANIQYDEIRNHGTGYYQFAKDKATRDKQMNTLNTLREQTVDLRAKREKLKEKRKAILDARLAKVKQRKMLRDGITIPDQDDTESKDAQDEDTVGPSIAEKYEEMKEDKKPLERDDTWRKTAPLREWDIGKDDFPEGEHKWKISQREERVDEFAPPQMYYENTNSKQKQTKHIGKKMLWKNKQQNISKEIDPKTIPLPQSTSNTNSNSGGTDLPENSSSASLTLTQDIPLPGVPESAQRLAGNYTGVEQHTQLPRQLSGMSSIVAPPMSESRTPLPPTVTLPLPSMGTYTASPSWSSTVAPPSNETHLPTTATLPVSSTATHTATPYWSSTVAPPGSETHLPTTATLPVSSIATHTATPYWSSTVAPPGSETHLPTTATLPVSSVATHTAAPSWSSTVAPPTATQGNWLNQSNPPLNTPGYGNCNVNQYSAYAANSNTGVAHQVPGRDGSSPTVYGSTYGHPDSQGSHQSYSASPYNQQNSSSTWKPESLPTNPAHMTPGIPFTSPYIQQEVKREALPVKPANPALMTPGIPFASPYIQQEVKTETDPIKPANPALMTPGIPFASPYIQQEEVPKSATIETQQLIGQETPSAEPSSTTVAGATNPLSQSIDETLKLLRHST